MLFSLFLAASFASVSIAVLKNICLDKVHSQSPWFVLVYSREPECAKVHTVSASSRDRMSLLLLVRTTT